jgi:hypothetical protein
MMAMPTQHFMMGYDETSRWDRAWQSKEADCLILNESRQAFVGAG